MLTDRNQRTRLNTVILLVGFAACGGGPSGPSPVATGTWGGDHVTMTVAATSHLEFDCAHGDIPSALSTDGDGRFTAAGTYVREHGGPIRQGEIPDSHPASYAGLVSGDRMTLTIRLTDTGEAVGAFSLQRGVAGRVVKCL